MSFEPVEIEINLKQNVETEGEKASKTFDDLNAASEKMRQELQSTIDAQKTAIRQLTAELESVKKLLESKTNTGDAKLISEKQQLADEVTRLRIELDKSEKAMQELENRQKTVTTSVVTGTEKMTESLKEFTKEEEIAFQKKIIEDLKSQLSEAEKAFNKFNIATHDEKTLAQRQKLGKVVKDLRAELKGEEEALGLLEQKTTATTVKMKSLETQIRETREAMANLKMQGRQNSQEYSELEKKLGLLGTAYREVFNTQRALSTGGAQMEGVLSGLSALSGLMSAGAGAFGLMNSESENFAKIQTKVQSLMAITIGLQQISNTLHATSAFRITTVAKAKLFWASATNKLSVALGISNVAAKALMATLTLGLSVAITAVMVLVDKFISNQRKAAEEQKKITDAVSQAAGEQITSFEKLKKSYEALEGKLEDQKKFLSDNKGEFEKLGIAVTDVNNAEKAFSDEGTAAFKTAVTERAKSLALMELAAERYKEIVAKELEVAEMPDVKTSSLGIKHDNRKKAKLKEEIASELTEWKKIIDQATGHEINAKTALSGAGFSTPDPKGDKAEDKIKAAAEKLAKMSADIQGEIDSAVVAAMQEGAAKKEAELKAHYDRQKAIIAQKLTEVAGLEKLTGKPATEQRSLLGSWAKAEDEKYKADIEQLRKVASEEISTIMADVEDRFKNHLDNQLSDINRNYDERIAKLRELKAEENKIAEVEAAREKEIALVTMQNELERLDFETQITLRRQVIKDRAMQLDMQKQENLLKIEKAGAEKRLQKLREMELAGADVADEIAEVTAALEEMNAELEDMPVKKFHEVLGVLQSIVGSNSKFGQVLSGISGHLESVQKLASAKKIGESILGGTSVIGGLYTLGKSINDAQQQKAQEQQQRYYDAQQRYITNMIKLIELQTKALKELKGEEKISGSKSAITRLQQDNANLEANAKKNIRVFENFYTERKLKWYGYVAELKKQYKDLSGFSMDELTRMRDLWLSNQEEFRGQYGGTFMTDEDFKVLDDYVNQYQAAQDQIRDIQNQVNENLTGSTYDSILSGIVDAFSDGTITAEEFGENFNSIMKKSMMNAFSRKYLEKQLEGWYDEFAAASDGEEGLTEAEIEALKKSLQSITNTAQQGLQTISEAAGLDLSAPGAASRQASSKALAAASQDSIDDLSGRITNIQGMVNDIRSYSAQKLDIERERRAMSMIIQGQLEAIADNTYYCRYLESMSRTLDDINIKGVKLKS